MNLKEILAFAVSIRDEHVDPKTDELILTTLEEEVQDHFDISAEEFNKQDLGYKIFKHLEAKNLL